MTAVIRVEGLGKRYRVKQRQEGGSDYRYRTLRESLVDMVRSPFRWRESDSYDDFWALQDVSFEVQPGEVVGIIGRNGAGKSTLLKILSRITKPTKGRVHLNGRVGSLLEVGTGFHPELTGRENVYLNGSILGMSRKEIARRFDEIVAFAEVERFLDTPVKRYSSGMYVRLAFAVAAHLEPEILVVDEVLAVGDTEFQKKCMGKMGEIGRAGRTVLFVSHNMYAISKLTQQTLFVERGRIAARGRTSEVVRKYLALDGTLKPEWERPLSMPAGGDIVITAIRCCDSDGQPASRLNADEPFFIEIEFRVSREVNGQIAFRLNSDVDSSTIFTTAMPDHLHRFATRWIPGNYRSRCRVPNHLLVPGSYHLLVAANNKTGPQFDMVEQVLRFEVTTVGSLTCIDGRRGIVAPLLDWDTEVVSQTAPNQASNFNGE